MLVQGISDAKKTVKLTAAAITLFMCLMFIYRLSGCMSDDTSKECAIAIVVVVFTWMITSTLYLLFDTSRFNGFILAYFISSAIRILLACVCIAFLMKYGDLRKHFLLLWSGVLYLLLLLVDTHFNVGYLRRLNRVRRDFFADNENEIDISQRQPYRRNSE